MYFFDQAYAATVYRGTLALSAAAGWFDRVIIDGIVNGSGYFTRFASWVVGLFDLHFIDGLVNGIAALLQGMGEGFRRFQKEQASSDVKRAETVLKQSETVARESEIRSPADGVVLHRMAEPGLLLGAGQPALTIAFADRLYVRTFVPETKLGRVRTGLAAQVTVDAFPGKTFAARVTEISPVAEFTPKAVETREERVNLVYAAKVDLDRGWAEPLVPGQPAEVTIQLAEAAPPESTKPRAVPSASLH